MRKLIALMLLIALATAASVPASADPPGGPKPHKFGPHTLFGTIDSLTATTLVLRRRRGGNLITADITDAVSFNQLGVLYIGRPVALHGDFDAKRVYHVNSITSANGIRFGSDPPDQ